MEEVCVFPFVFSRQPILSTDVLFKKFDNLDEIVEFYLNEDLALKALQDANPTVANELYKYKKGEITKKKKIRNLFLTLENYLIRMGTRTTPFRLLTQESMIPLKPEKQLYGNTMSNNAFIAGPCAKIDEKNKGKIELRVSSLFVKRLKNIYLERQNKQEKIVTIRNNDFLEYILNCLNDWIPYFALWEKVKKEYPQISESGFIKYINRLILLGLLCSSQANKCIQEPLNFSVNTTTLPKKIEGDMKKIIDVLSHFVDSKQEYLGWSKLEKYFRENYEFERIPLSQVVYDDEFIFWKNVKEKYEKGKNYRLLKEYIDLKLKNGEKNVEISPEFLSKLENTGEKHNLSGDLLFSYFVSQNRIIIDSGIGSSRSGKIVGRYINLFPKKMKQKFRAFELNSLNIDNSIKAEVKYLFSDTKFAAINNKSNVYKYEINLNAPLDRSKTELPISSLSVGVDQDGLYLWSEQLCKKVIPQFTNAINGLAVESEMYRFLYLISRNRYEKFKPVLPYYLEDRKWSPRLTYENIIIKREEWRLDSTFLSEYKKDFNKALKNWQNRYNVPSIVGLSQGEAPIIYDLNNLLHLSLLKRFLMKKDVKQMSFVEVPEIMEWHESKINQLSCLFYVPAEISDKNMNSVILTQKRTKTDKVSFSQNLISINVFPSFYLKDSLSVVKTLVRDLKCKYFFINYLDDQRKSIRLRIWPININLLKDILLRLDSLSAQKVIYDYQLVNYLPEYSRYGGKSIYNQMLTAFYQDSKNAVNTEGMDNLDKRLATIDGIIRILDFTTIKSKIWQQIQGLNNKLITKHSPIVKELEEFNSKYNSNIKYQVQDGLEDYLKLIKLEYMDDPFKYYSILMSFIHMHVNRYLAPSKKEEQNIYLSVLEYYRIKEDANKYGKFRK